MIMAGSDNIQVAIRVRQLIQKEFSNGHKSHWTVKNNTICCDDPEVNGRKPTPYSFDRVFDHTAVTQDIFDEVCKPIVDSALAGFNGTIFAYGQSSSGKTFTMSGTRVQQGVISLAVDEIFSHIKSIPDREFLIRVGYLEIYNEKVSDLLSNEENSSLKLQEDSNHNIQVVGMTEEVVKDVDEVNSVVMKGTGKRHTAETRQNDRSSRSHCIIRFVIESRLVGHEDDAVMVSNLYFVDLAGSEKAGDNSGDRFKEGCSINKSLFILGMVIRKLSGDSSQQHVSFRDSKLTRILQNALGGNSKTAIICTITPAHVDDTDGTLKFASQAKNIKNKPMVNEVMNDAAMLKQYRKRIKDLEKHIQKMGDPTEHVEKAELERQLQVKEAAEKEQADMIAKLQTMLVISGTQGSKESEKPKERRRMTWCPGKAKRELGSLPHFSPLKRSRVMAQPSLMPVEESTVMEMTQVQEADDSFQLLDNVPVITSNSFLVSTNTSPVNETINSNPYVKELFELQDKHEALMQETSALKAELKRMHDYCTRNNVKNLQNDLTRTLSELNELQEFTQFERENEAETIRELQNKLTAYSDLESSLQWMEEELMKTQQERNNLRQKVEAMNRKLSAVEDGSGITDKANKLSETEALVSSLNSDMDVQKSRYEFHIQQMKKKLEVYTNILDEKGVDPDVLKQRLSSEGATHEEAMETERSMVQELREEYEQELECQRGQFQADLNEAREEIEIYQQLLQAEKDKKKFEEVKDEISVYEKRLEEQRVQIEQILLEKDEACSKLLKIEADMEAQKAKFEIENNQLREEITTMKTEKPDSIVLLENELKEAKEDIEIYQQMLRQKNSQPQPANSPKPSLMAELMEAKCANPESKMETDEYEKTIESLQAEHEKEMNELKNKIIALQQSNTKESDADTTIREEVEIANLKAAHEQELTVLQYEFQRQRDEVKSKNEEIDVKDNEIIKLRAVYEQELSDLRNNLKAIKEDTSSFAETGVTESAEEIIAKIKDIHQQEIADLREELNALRHSDTESNVLEGVISRVEYEHSLENIKASYEKELTELKDKLKEVEQNVPNDMISKVDDEQSLESVKASYEEELTELKLKLSAVEENVPNDLISRVDYEQSLENMKASYEKELTELKEKLSAVEENVPNDMTSSVHFEQSLENVKASYEKELTELKEKLSAVEENVPNDMISSFHFEQSLENVKASYEKELTELKLKLSVLEENVPNDMISSVHFEQSLENVKASYEKELTDLKEKLTAVEQSLSDSMIGKVEYEHSFENIRASYEKELTNLKEKLSTVQQNLLCDMMSKLDYEQSLENVRASYEKKLKEKLSAVKQNVPTDMSMMDCEQSLENIRSSHEKELTELKDKLSAVEQNVPNDMMSIDYEQSLENMRMTYEKELTELKDKLSAVEQNVPHDMMSVNYEQSLESIRLTYEKELTELKDKLSVVEQNVPNDMMSKVDYEQSLENVRLMYEKELTELKDKLSAMEENVPNGLMSKVDYEQSLENIRLMYEKELTELKDKLSEVEQNVPDMMSKVECEHSLENLRVSHENELTELKNKLITAEQTQNDNVTMKLKLEYEGTIVHQEEAYEEEIAALKCELGVDKQGHHSEPTQEAITMEYEQTKDNADTIEISGTHYSKCSDQESEESARPKKNRRQVTFDFGLELEMQKERYELKIKDLTEENESYREMLDSLQAVDESVMNGKEVDDVFEVAGSAADVTCDKVEEAVDVEMGNDSVCPDVSKVEVSQETPAKFKETCNEVDSSIRTDVSMDDADFTVLDYDISVVNRRDSVYGESLQAELMKAGLGNNGSTCETENMTNATDLNSELLRAEIETIKEKHELEVEELKNEIASLKQKVDMETHAMKMTETLSSDATVLGELSRPGKEFEEHLAQQGTDTSFQEPSGSPLQLHSTSPSLAKQGTNTSFQEPSCSRLLSLNTSSIHLTDATPDTDAAQGIEKVTGGVGSNTTLDTSSFEDSVQASFVEESKSFIEEKYVTKTLGEAEEIISTLKIALKQLVEEIEKLQPENSRLKRDYRSLVTEREELLQKYTDLERKYSELEDEKEVLAGKIEELEEHIRYGTGLLSNKNEEIKMLKESLEEQESLVESEMAKKTEEIQEYVAGIEEKVASLESELKIGNEKVSELEEIESQFSDKIVVLESEIEVYKENEVTLNKMCGDYEEKIATLDGDAGLLKQKNEDLEEVCTYQERKIETLQMDLEVAQSKDYELAEIQNKYQEKISKLENEIKDSHSQLEKLSNEHTDLQQTEKKCQEKINQLEDELNQKNEYADTVRKEKDESEEKLQAALKELENANRQDAVYSATIQELKEEIKLQKEQIEAVKTKLEDAEAEVRGFKDTVTENNFLRERVDTLEKDSVLSGELISELETEVSELRKRLEEHKKQNENKVELEHQIMEQKLKTVEGDRSELQVQLKELQVKMDELKSKVVTLNDEKDEVQSKLNAAQEDKKATEESVETLNLEIVSLQEDKFQLEAGLPPQAVRFHSQPENVQWEQKWKEFEREEKLKRLTLNSKLRSVMKELAHAQKMAKAAKDEALKELHAQETETEQYKDLRQRWQKAEDDANALNDELETEQEASRKLRAKLEELEKKKAVVVTDENHHCKFKTDFHLHDLELKKVRHDLTIKEKQLRENEEDYNKHIKKLKNDMRRMQCGMDDTFNPGMVKPPTFDETPMKQQQQQQQPLPTPTVNMSSKEGGIVDHFKVVLMTAEMKTLQQELSKAKKKLEKFEKIEKENLNLKPEQTRKPEVKVDMSTSMSESISFRDPLSTKTKNDEEPVIKKRKPSFTIPDLNPVKGQQEDPNNCKSQ